MTLSSCCSKVLSSGMSVSDYSVSDHAEMTLNQVITDILATGDISRSNQVYLSRLMRSSELLSGRDVILIDRVFQRLQMGLLRVTED